MKMFRHAGRLWRVFRVLLVGIGLFAVLLAGLCFTSYPWRLYRWLGDPESTLERAPAWIVVLGGGGIPSESGLMRTYYGAQVAFHFPEAQVVIALPDKDDETVSALGLMRDELILRGVAPSRIRREDEGRNTREQALKTAALIGDEFASQPVLVVTSPEHVRRAVYAFQSAGFECVAGQAAWNSALEEDLNLDRVDLGGHIIGPDLGGSLLLRYVVWDNMKYLADASRELTALAYYWLRGWI